MNTVKVSYNGKPVRELIIVSDSDGDIVQVLVNDTIKVGDEGKVFTIDGVSLTRKGVSNYLVSCENSVVNMTSFKAAYTGTVRHIIEPSGLDLMFADIISIKRFNKELKVLENLRKVYDVSRIHLNLGYIRISIICCNCRTLLNYLSDEQVLDKYSFADWNRSKIITI